MKFVLALCFSNDSAWLWQWADCDQVPIIEAFLAIDWIACLFGVPNQLPVHKATAPCQSFPLSFLRGQVPAAALVTAVARTDCLPSLPLGRSFQELD